MTSNVIREKLEALKARLSEHPSTRSTMDLLREQAPHLLTDEEDEFTDEFEAYRQVQEDRYLGGTR